MIIVLPAIGVIVQQAIQAAAVGAVIGAVTSGGAGAAVEIVEGVHEHGEITREVLDEAAYAAINSGAEGAIVGGAFGAGSAVIAPVVAPAIQVVDDVARPVFQVVDDAARPVIQAADDAIRPAMRAVDNAVRPVINKVGESARSVGHAIASPINHVRNALNARFFNHLPKTTGSSGYVYVMDDVRYARRYKIGMTNNPARRLGEVQNKVGRNFNYTCIIPSGNMRALESTMHTAFASQNLPNTGTGREFFRLNPSQLAAACSY
ncbi:MAG: GIY-YIG nuclease family protein [Chloroflexota bacterium]|nr:GIY-YIG nuclease family protein [Chloroflexota bacterium]